MTTIQRLRLPDMREVQEEDRAAWISLAEDIREDPEILGYFEAKNPELYLAVVAGLQSLAIDARSWEWRSAHESVGGRPEQLLPGTPGSFSERTDWLTWLLMGGRGSGKSRTGGEGTRELLQGRKWLYEKPVWGLVGQTLEAVRIQMVENTLLKILPPGSVARWNRNTVELYLTNGAFLKGFSAQTPDRIRGWNLHGAWADELASWPDADKATAEDGTWSVLKLAVRAHDNHTWIPRIIATTTPRPKRLLRNPDPKDPEHPGKGIYDDPTTVISSMSTMANIANLPPSFFATVIEPLQGSRLYEQEVEGKLIDAVIGAQWSWELIERMKFHPDHPETLAGGLQRIVIGVDPSVGAGLAGECGIVVVGIALDGRAYVLEDCSKRCPADEWVAIIARAYSKWHASAVVVEINQGGELVRETLGRYAPNLPIVEVRGKKGKTLRAEPIAHLSTRDRVRFASDELSALQLQMRTWDGSGDSPDRLDAFVYACLYLLPVGGLDELISVNRGGARFR